MIRLLIAFSALLLYSCSAQKKMGPAARLPPDSLQGPQDVSEFGYFIDSFINARLQKEMIPGAAFAFVKDGKTFYMKGYGLANIETQKIVDPATTIFRIGSISKVFTTDALLKLAAENKISLDTDVNHYLHNLKVPATFSKPVTVRHLITHSAGFDEIRPGTQAVDSTTVLPLKEFLKNKLVRLWSPGEIIMYSTYGITLGGLLVEEVTQDSFEKYLEEHIALPLGMNNTSINVPMHLQNNLATGYEIEAQVNQPQRWEWYHTTPASSINSTAEDMTRWIIAHLDDKGLLPGAWKDKMRSHQLGLHPRMYGMAFGFFEEYYGDLRFLYHGGNMAGFNSLVVLIPTANAGFFFVSQHEGSNLRGDLEWAILDRYYKNNYKPIIPVLSSDNERTKAFAGQYQYNVYCHTCPGQRSTMKFTIKANEDGSIQLNNRRWMETEDKLLFRREDGKSTIAFRADSSGKITHVSFGGYWTFEKVD